ncbi:39S ribosomal protein L16, mitochondrial [Zootermopsis nevadensis]|uniref:Large ribosomal subunit protein uL16m n=1 Tax=Zootermopsis nevadensis TaxID=136037 RepID=A0A067RDG8_ZOONE|nr:39S ribosomal protein L16, mitochondrial [Zootermopsis nevadensis]KDR21926.1 39S ribosomal protein L16, mitochondrial [Zootermopsis nevadensis]
MQYYRVDVFRKLLCNNATPNIIQVAGVNYFAPPPKYDHVEFPERSKLRYMDKVPLIHGNMRPPKMTKSLKFMRGPETVHNFLLHQQFGIIALSGGRMKWGHFEMVRLGVLRKMDQNRMFAVWRIDAPWQPITKKGLGQRMGGGKGPIDHYVTPVKAGRVIIEMGGKCEFVEVQPILELVAHKLPFAAKVVSQQMMQEMAEEEERSEKENLNHYTFKYVIQNNLGGCHNWISPYDKKWFGKYL